MTIRSVVILLMMAGTSLSAASNSLSSVGVNLDKNTDYSTQNAFVNEMNSSREWMSHSSNSDCSWSEVNLPLDLDPLGWPKSLALGQAAATLMHRDKKGHYPSGVYTVNYEGEGQLIFCYDGQVISSQPGQILVNVIASNAGVYMKLIATNPANPMRNITFIMPGHANTYLTQPFTPDFTNRLRPFRVIRFMDFQRTNDSPVIKWSDRTPENAAQQTTDSGVGLGYMIQLANQLGADPWFCMPHMADNDYVTQFATQVRDQLAPNLKAYLEYSNEVWNPQFAQSLYAQQQGLSLGLGNGNAYGAGLEYYSKRAVEIMNIWSQVFAGQTNRLVRVLAGQSGNPWTGQVIMDFNGAHTKADAYAIAPYIGGSYGNPLNAPTVQNWSVERLIKALYIDVQQILPVMQTNVQNAVSRGLVPIAYEGGQHLAGYGGAENNVSLTNLFIATNNDPAMHGVYTAYMDAWKLAGGKMFVHFNFISTFTKWGSWGLTEHSDTHPLESPKFKALGEWIRANPQ